MGESAWGADSPSETTMTPANIILLVIAFVIMGGVAWWALRTPTKEKAPEGQRGTDDQNRQYRNDVLMGRAAPPRDDDPRRDTSGRCLPPWHSVLQPDLSSHCDLPDGFTVIPDWRGGWTGHDPNVTDVGVLGAVGTPVPRRSDGGTGAGIGSVTVTSR